MTTIDILKKTKAAWQHISSASAEEKNTLLLAMADSHTRTPFWRRTGWTWRRLAATSPR